MASYLVTLPAEEDVCKGCCSCLLSPTVSSSCCRVVSEAEPRMGKATARSTLTIHISGAEWVMLPNKHGVGLLCLNPLLSYPAFPGAEDEPFSSSLLSLMSCFT